MKSGAHDLIGQKKREALYAIAAMFVTACSFAVLPAFDDLAGKEKKTLELQPAPVIISPPRSYESVEEPAPQPSPPPEFVSKPVEPASPRQMKTTPMPRLAQFDLSIGSLQSGLGDLSLGFATIAVEDAPVRGVIGERLNMEFSLQELDSAPRLLNPSKPPYPLQARRRRIEGWVELKFKILPNGSVADVEVVAAEPEGVFEKSAKSTLKSWTFFSPRKNGVPVTVRVCQQIKFHLE